LGKQTRKIDIFSYFGDKNIIGALQARHQYWRKKLSPLEYYSRVGEIGESLMAHPDEPIVEEENRRPTADPTTKSETQTGQDHTSTGQDDEHSGTSERHSDSGESKPEYLVALDYRDDAERKRVEYLLNNSSIEVEKLQGLVRLVRTDDIEDFYEDLSAKVDELDHLRVDELSEVDITPDEHHERFSLETEASRDKIKWAFDTIEKKRDATIEDREYDTEYGYHQYVTTTKSGTVRYSYEMDRLNDGTTRVDVHIWGYGDAPETFREFVENELNYAI